MKRFSISGNPLLATLKRSALETVGEALYITENASLSCDADAITTQVTAMEMFFCENAAGSTCGDDVCSVDTD